MPPKSDDDEAAPAEPSSWFSSAALHFKEGRKKSASFAVVIEPVSRVAERFGISTIPQGGARAYFVRAIAIGRATPRLIVSWGAV